MTCRTCAHARTNFESVRGAAEMARAIDVGELAWDKFLANPCAFSSRGRIVNRHAGLKQTIADACRDSVAAE